MKGKSGSVTVSDQCKERAVSVTVSDQCKERAAVSRCLISVRKERQCHGVCGQCKERAASVTVSVII